MMSCFPSKPINIENPSGVRAHAPALDEQIFPVLLTLLTVFKREIHTAVAGAWSQCKRSCMNNLAHESFWISFIIIMGNFIRACLGRDCSAPQMQRKTDLSRDFLTVFKVIYYALFHVAPRGGAYADADNAGTANRRSSAASPANVLRLLFRRDALKSKGEDSMALSQCESLTEEASCTFSFDSEEDHGSEINLSEKQMVPVPDCPAIGLLTRLDTEVQTLKRKLDRQEDEVKRLTEEVVSLRANADKSLVRSQKRQARIDGPGNLLSDGSEDASPRYVDTRPSRFSHDLLKWDNMGLFQAAALEAPKHVNDVRLCTPQEKGGGKVNLGHPGTDMSQSPRKVAPNVFWEPFLQSSLAPVKVRSSNARQSMDCKYANFVDNEFGNAQDAFARSEIEVDDMDNLSMFSYGSADIRDFRYGDSPKCVGRGDCLQEQAEWSAEEPKKDHIIHISQSSPRTGTDPGRAARRGHMQQKYEELEEELFKILQSPRRELLPDIMSSNSSSRASSRCSSPRNKRSTMFGESRDRQTENGLSWEPYRESASPRSPQNVFQKRKLVDDADFATQPVKTLRASPSSKSKTHHSSSSESSGHESDSERCQRQEGRIVKPDQIAPAIASTQIELGSPEVLAVSSGESGVSSPPVVLAEESRGQVGIDEVALETFKICEGEIYTSENSRRNPTEGGLYRDGRGSKSCGKTHMRRHSSFNQGCRQSRFAVEAARLSMRRQGHHRGMSF
ncbi:hypothetical protein R1sor_027575 [Riccia sorocarpa]|uniref:Uncharacterized protein n=1 Tax=Riccia sorocarpa TaxID=122646 RepID=A0ABD3GEK6_9MARC